MNSEKSHTTLGPMMSKSQVPDVAGIATRAHRYVIAVILLAHLAILSVSASLNSPLHNEVAHLPAGISHWQHGSFALYRVNPPLVRMIAAIPVLLFGERQEIPPFDNGPYARPEFQVGVQYAHQNGERGFWYYTWARWACLPFSFLGAWTCYRWSADLFGRLAGLMALGFWCFCPYVLGWGATIIPDLGSASVGVTACYQFWKWMKSPTRAQGVIAGLMLGLTLLTKTTWLILFVVWPACWIIALAVVLYQRNLPVQENREESVARSSLLGLAGILLLGVYVLNLGYGFSGTGKPLGQYQFISQSLSGQKVAGNRFHGTVLERLPIPLPEDYVRGVDIQKHDFESRMWSYLRGEHRQEGWWYYYLYGLSVKTPVGTILIAAIALLLALWGICRAQLIDEVVLLLPPVAILILLSSQTGFNHHIRYAIPVIPFMYIGLSRVAQLLHTGSRWQKIVIALTGISGIAESLMHVPHSLAFFNVLAGGPRQGHKHLLDSNIDWGQDLYRLRQWQEKHPEVKPCYCDVYGAFPLDTLRIRLDPKPNNLIRPPGWYVISTNRLHGYDHQSHSAGYSDFLLRTPDDRVGTSIQIYHIP